MKLIGFRSCCLFLAAALFPLPLVVAQTADAPALERAPAPDATNGIITTNHAAIPRETARGKSSHRSNMDLTAVFNDTAVREGETARMVVVVGGGAVIDGVVEQNLVVVLGTARLGPKADIKHDLIIVGGTVEADPAARIGGHRVLIGPGGKLGALAWRGWPRDWVNEGLLWARPLPPQFAWSWIVAAVALLFYVVIAVLFPRPVQASVAALEEKPGRALLLGLLALLLFAPLLVLLLFTVVGIVLVPFLVGAMALAFLFGKAAVFRYTGQQLGGQFGLAASGHPVLALLSGALLFCLLYMIPVVGFLAWLVIAPLGLGAAFLAFFKRNKPKPDAAAESAAPPPEDTPGGSIFGAAPAPTLLLPRVGFWVRLCATLLDLVLIGVILRVFHAPQLFLPVWIIYHLALWSWHGATLGDLVLGLRLVRQDGGPLKFSVVLVRALASCFSFIVLCLGFFWAGWDRGKQAWHDKIAGTIVVRVSRAAVLA